MSFKLNVKLTDKDYLDFNIFWSTRSYHGKKQVMQLRFLTALLFIVACFAHMAGTGFAIESLWVVAFYLVALVIFQFCINPLLIGILKSHIKSMSKKGKALYSPESTVEFYDDHFVDITADNRNEMKYTCLQRISIVGDQVIYLHMNVLMAVILPFSAFENVAERDAFLEFIKAKCPTVSEYN